MHTDRHTDTQTSVYITLLYMGVKKCNKLIRGGVECVPLDRLMASDTVSYMLRDVL